MWFHTKAPTPGPNRSILYCMSIIDIRYWSSLKGLTRSYIYEHIGLLHRVRFFRGIVSEMLPSSRWWPRKQPQQRKERAHPFQAAWSVLASASPDWTLKRSLMLPWYPLQLTWDRRLIENCFQVMMNFTGCWQVSFLQPTGPEWRQNQGQDPHKQRWPSPWVWNWVEPPCWLESDHCSSGEGRLPTWSRRAKQSLQWSRRCPSWSFELSWPLYSYIHGGFLQSHPPRQEREYLSFSFKFEAKTKILSPNIRLWDKNQNWD